MMKPKHIISALLVALAVASCAIRGTGPQGGPKDETPPAVVKYSPADSSVNFVRKGIEITFDEIVTLDNPYQKVIVSPPQKEPAEIKALGRRIVVNFMDTLLDSTTYNIDFTDAIADNNEGNKLKGFSYCFSTGDHLDSLQLSGIVIDAENLNPVPNIYVGIHSDLDDTAFTSIPFKRISLTDENGHFSIRNVSPGKYHLFALADIASNFYHDMPNERIAFIDSVFIPECVVTTRYDTLWTDSVISPDSILHLVDTIRTTTKRHLYPRNVNLMSFVSFDPRQYLVKSERTEKYCFTLIFNSSLDTLPTIQPLNFSDSIFHNIVTPSVNRDTISYWLTDSALWALDTLRILCSYIKTDADSTYGVTDTLSLAMRRGRKTSSLAGIGSSSSDSGKAIGNKPDTNKQPGKSSSRKTSKGNKRKNEDEKTATTENPHLISSNASTSFDIYLPIRLQFTIPAEIEHSSYKLEQKIDTVWQELPAPPIVRQNVFGTQYTLSYSWQPASAYRLTIDSAMFRNFIGQCNFREIVNITTKPLEQYSSLILNLTEVTGNEVVQLLDKDDKVIREIALSDTTADLISSVSIKQSSAVLKFLYVTPSVYYLRLYNDIDGNRKWTTGSYPDHRQPEPVTYFPFDIELRAFWDVEEDWAPTSTPLLQQKPKELVKTEKEK